LIFPVLCSEISAASPQNPKLRYRFADLQQRLSFTRGFEAERERWHFDRRCRHCS
jgi:hypothetical protein